MRHADFSIQLSIKQRWAHLIRPHAIKNLHNQRRQIHQHTVHHWRGSLKWVAFRNVEMLWSALCGSCLIGVHSKADVLTIYDIILEEGSMENVRNMGLSVIIRDRRQMLKPPPPAEWSCTRPWPHRTRGSTARLLASRAGSSLLSDLKMLLMRIDQNIF